MSAEEDLGLAKQHLKRVQAAWDHPTDWGNLATYGFYCLEAAVCAAADHSGIPFTRSHYSKAEASLELASQHGLPEIHSLLRDLNDARKSVAYGDIVLPDMDAEDVASAIEGYVEAVEKFLAT